MAPALTCARRTRSRSRCLAAMADKSLECPVRAICFPRTPGTFRTEDYLRSAFGRARRSRPASARVAPVELEILRARALHDVRPQLALCQRSEVLRPPCASVFPYLPSPGTLGRAAHSALRCLQRHCSNIWSDASLHRALLRPSRHLAARLCTGPESASVSVGRITPTWCWHELNSPLSMHV